MGRYLRIAAQQPAQLVVGLDLSRAVLAARDLTAGLDRVSVVRGDLLRLPFAAQTFDQIYSLGVIDHTPDPRGAFLALARLLKPGGRIVVWVYPRERRLVEWMMNAQRAVSTRLPVGLLELLCSAAAPIGGLKRRLMSSPRRLIQRLGVALHVATIGVSMHPDAEVRVCDTLDLYAPKFMSRHSIEEVAGWFAEAGLTEVADLSAAQVFYHEGQGHGVNLAGSRPPIARIGRQSSIDT
jgi:SAM-dependent methyltransferase